MFGNSFKENTMESTKSFFIGHRGVAGPGSAVTGRESCNTQRRGQVVTIKLLDAPL